MKFTFRVCSRSQMSQVSATALRLLLLLFAAGPCTSSLPWLCCVLLLVQQQKRKAPVLLLCSPGSAVVRSSRKMAGQWQLISSRPLDVTQMVACQVVYDIKYEHSSPDTPWSSSTPILSPPSSSDVDPDCRSSFHYMPSPKTQLLKIIPKTL